ncbi:MAG TPA: MFS transporter [Actinocrinis sp.]|nr:MFS transporter [Actinocrinis sp.]
MSTTTAAAGGAPAPRTSSALLPILAVGAFAIGTDTFVVAGVLPAVAHDLKSSFADVGWVSTVFALAYGILAPVLGALTGRLERRSVLIASLLGFAVFNAASALAPDLALLLVARVLTAASASLYIPAAGAAAAATAAPERRGRAMAVVFGGIAAATVLGVPFGTWLSADIAWRATFWLLAGLGLLCAAAVTAGLPEIRLPASPGLAARLAPARDTRVLLTVVTTFLFMTGGYLVLTYIGGVLDPVTAGDGTTLALLLLAFGVAGVAGSNLGGRAVDKWGPTSVLLVAVAVLALVLASVPTSRQTTGLAIAAMAVWGLAAMATQPAQQHRMFGIAPTSGPLLLSLNSSATFLGIAAGGFVGGQVLEHGGANALTKLGPIGAVLAVLALVTAVVGARIGAPRPAAPAGSAASPAADQVPSGRT